MATRVVEWKKPYTWGKAIEIDENKVISLRLRDENNLIIYDEWDDEIYVDLQLQDWIRPIDAFPVWITTGRVLVADDWDITGTLICAKTTSWDNIKLLYGDDGTLWIDNWTWTFKQIYFKSDVDQLLQNLRTYVNQQLALKQDKLIAGDNITIDPTTNTISADVPPLSRFLSLWDCTTWLPLSFPASVPFDYVTGDHYLVETVWATNYRPSGSRYDGTASITVETDSVAVWDSYIYDGTVWLLQKNSWGVVSFSNIAWQPADNTALANALNDKANATDVNTKTFYLSWTSGATALAEAQAAYNWYLAGENPIIIYNNMAFSLYSNTTLAIQFVSNYDYTIVNNSYSKIYKKSLTFVHNSWSSTITDIYYNNQNVDAVPFLSPWNNYSTPYTPEYNWSPTSKKYVDDRDTYIWSSAPTSNLAEWRLWYDTTNDKLKVYDWSNWNEVWWGWAWGQITGTLSNQTDLQAALNDKQDELHDGVNTSIADWPEYAITTESDMRWPCPSGFHVPLQTEWQSVVNIWTALGGWSSDWTNFWKNLKLPFAGNRGHSDATITNVGSYWRYWTATYISTTNARDLDFSATSISYNGSDYRTYGCAIRWFKNTPVTPTETWTMLYWTSIAAWWIFWDSTDWLISLSSDWSIWITIADKNLWATAVWNYWDTLTDANCGNIFQWGNNYWFAHSWSVTSSTTRVDASTYWPWNYYSSSTYIKYSWDWSNPSNNNLRWWVSQWTTTSKSPTWNTVLRVNATPSIGSSAPSYPENGTMWYDTSSNALKVYDGTNWNLAWDESNTKTFYLAWTSGTTNIATAQAAYNWYVAGKNPIVVYDGANYTYYQASSSSIYFAGNKYSYSTTSSGTQTQYYYVRFTLSSGTVTGIYTGIYWMWWKYLATDNTSSYTPSGDYNPATKKYVDDKIATRLKGKIYYLDASLTNLDLSRSDMFDICWTLDGGGTVVLWMDISSTYSTMKNGYYYITKYVADGDADDTYHIYAVNFGEPYEYQICKVHIIITNQMNDASIDEIDVSYVFRSDSSASWKTLVKSGTGTSNYGWQRPWAYDSTTAPTNPSRGTLWRDRTNNVVKLYNGSSWQTYYPSNAPIQVVSALPATPDADTVYIITS